MSREYVFEPPFHDRVRRVLGSKGVTKLGKEPVKVTLDDMEYRVLARKARDRHLKVSVKPTDGKPAPGLKGGD